LSDLAEQSHESKLAEDNNW